MREIAWDVETTGINPVEDRIIEIGAVEMEDLIPTGRTFHCYINPQRDVPPGAVRVHGLTYDFLKKFPTFRRQIYGFLKFIEGARLVAHNGAFDLRMLAAEMERNGLSNIDNETVDTLPLARKVKRTGRHKLEDLCQHFGVTDTREKHGALLDSTLLAEVYLHLRGGRQHAMALPQIVVPEPEVIVQHGPRCHILRGFASERAAHAEFVGGMKDPIWSRYESESLDQKN